MKSAITFRSLEFRGRLLPGRCIKLNHRILRRLGWKTDDMVACQIKGNTLIVSRAPSKQEDRIKRLKERHQTFREKYGVALAWSNSQASNDVLIRRALVAPRFQVLLDAALEFGIDKLSAEWALLREEGSSETLRAAPVTERILRHIREGYKQAGET